MMSFFPRLEYARLIVGFSECAAKYSPRMFVAYKRSNYANNPGMQLMNQCVFSSVLSFIFTI